MAKCSLPCGAPMGAIIAKGMRVRRTQTGRRKVPGSEPSRKRLEDSPIVRPASQLAAFGFHVFGEHGAPNGAITPDT